MGHMVVAQDLSLTTSNVDTEWYDQQTGAAATLPDYSYTTPSPPYTVGDSSTPPSRVIVRKNSANTEDIFPQGVYEALSDGVTSYPPDNPADWLYLGAINRHKMFDGTNNQRTVADAGDDIEITVTASGRVRFIYFVGLRNVTKIDVIVAHGTRTLFYTSDLLISYSAIGWYSWLYDISGIDRSYRRSAGFRISVNTAPLLSPTITATLYSRGTDQPAECGQVIMGNGFWLGDTEWGVEPELKDYSTYSADEFGNRVLVPRQTTRNMRGTLWVPTNDYDRVFSLFESRMNQLALFDFNNGDDISASEVKDALRVYGKLTSLTGGLAYNKTPLNLSIEGGN